MNGDDDLLKLGGRWIVFKSTVGATQGHAVEYQISEGMDQIRARAEFEEGEIMWETLEIHVQEADAAFSLPGDLEVRVKAIIKTWRAS